VTEPPPAFTSFVASSTPRLTAEKNGSSDLPPMTTRLTLPLLFAPDVDPPPAVAVASAVSPLALPLAQPVSAVAAMAARLTTVRTLRERRPDGRLDWVRSMCWGLLRVMPGGA
jgi:hypothetical protein